jgi:hypothetical protein
MLGLLSPDATKNPNISEPAGSERGHMLKEKKI